MLGKTVEPFAEPFRKIIHREKSFRIRCQIERRDGSDGIRLLAVRVEKAFHFIGHVIVYGPGQHDLYIQSCRLKIR